VKKPSFIAREAFLWLALFAPAVTLLVSRFGSGPEPLERVAGCLLSTWSCTIVCGLSVHAAINAVAPTLLARTSRFVAISGIAVAGAAALIASMSLLLPRLVWLDPNVAGSHAPFLLQGLAVGALYVAFGRLATWLAERARQSEAKSLRARLEALQAQTNPHFLFNTLNAIASLIPTNPAKAESMIERLASVLHYSLASSSRGRVTLAEELDAVRDYLEIEQARYGARLRATIDVEQGLDGDVIVPMLLQPLVENAVLHGLSSKDDGGAVTVHGRVERDSMVLKVSDDGVGPGGSKRRGHRTGLANVRERLALTYGAAARLSVGARPGGGFECEIRLPRASSF
jgi:two-component sensor histidine kinase